MVGALAGLGTGAATGATAGALGSGGLFGTGLGAALGKSALTSAEGMLAGGSIWSKIGTTLGGLAGSRLSGLSPLGSQIGSGMRLWGDIRGGRPYETGAGDWASTIGREKRGMSDIARDIMRITGYGR